MDIITLSSAGRNRGMSDLRKLEQRGRHAIGSGRSEELVASRAKRKSVNCKFPQGLKPGGPRGRLFSETDLGDGLMTSSPH